METMEYIGAIAIGLWLSYAVKLIKERIAIHRNAKRLARMQEINNKMEKLFRNNADYCNGAVDAFLSGDMETAQKFIDACNEEADKIEDLARQFRALERDGKQA